QTLGSGISILLAVGTPSTGSGNLYCQWELSPRSGNALCILFPTPPSPPHQSPRASLSQAAEGTSILVQQVLDKCSALVHRVEGLESANTAQQLEILKLKARVMKLERLNKVKISKLRHLKKVGTSQRIKSSENEENVFNQGRISVDMGDEGIEKRKEVVIRDLEEELHDDTPAETQSAKDKGKGILVEDPKPMKKKDQIAMDAEYARKLQEEEESLTQAKDAQAKDAQAIDVQPKDAPAKGIQYIRRYHGYKKKPQSKSEASKNMIDYLKNTEGFKLAFFKGKTYDQIRLIFYARFDANMRFLLKSKEEMEKKEEEIIKSINKTPAQKAAKRRRLREQAKEDENLKKQLEVVADEDDDVFVEATPSGTKVPVVNYEVVMINNKPRYKIFRADDTLQLYTSFITLLKNFDREDLEDLWK
nr:hypothetical protein [Tanacetum cinerariifolium]